MQRRPLASSGTSVIAVNGPVRGVELQQAATLVRPTPNLDVGSDLAAQLYHALEQALVKLQGEEKRAPAYKKAAP